MAKTSKFKFSNILVWVLLAMLVFGLAGFGVTSFGGNVRAVGSVGKTVIDANAYARALEQQLNTLREQAGPELTFAEAEQFGLTQSVLAQRVGLAAMEDAARQAGISVGDEEVGRRIQEIPSFQGPTGNFDRDAYDFVLERTGMTPTTFEDTVRRDASSSILRSALVTAMTPPSTYGETLYRFYTEARQITYAAIEDAQLATQPEAPTEAEIAAFYEENPALFTVPATKEITYAWLSPAMLSSEVLLSDAELRTAYDQRGELYNRAERRMVNRLGFADVASAQAALDAITAGETTFDAILADRGLTETDVDLGAITRDALTTGAADAVFATEDTGLVGPVDSAVGPAIFRVNAILTAQSTSFEDALPELREDLARSAAEALVVDEIESLDDLLAGGATLEELAAETPMQLGQVSWTAAEVTGDLPVTLEEFQTAAQSLTAGAFPEILISDNGMVFAMRLDTEVPATLLPLDEKRDEATAGATAGATAAKLTDALTTRAEELRSELDAGQSFSDLGLPAISRGDLTRQRPALDLPLSILTAIYEMSDSETSVVSDVDGVYLVRVDRINVPDSSTPEAKTVLDRLSQEFGQITIEEILGQFASAIANEAGVTYDQNSLDAIHTALR